MKSYIAILAIITLLLSMSSTAQIHSGVYSIKGTGSYSNTKEEFLGYKTEHTLFSLSPGLTYFISNNIELNWSLDYNQSKYTYPLLSSTTTMTIVSVGLRLYAPFDEFAVFAGGGIGKSEASENFNYLYEGGIDYFLYQSIAVEPSIIYSLTHNGNYTLSGIRLGIGFRYFME